jgi:hypothetical protein
MQTFDIECGMVGTDEAVFHGGKIHMANIDRDWIKSQFAKGVIAQTTVISSEKDHAERLNIPWLVDTYNLIIRDDEAHLVQLKRIAAKYGYESGSATETAGGIFGSIKSAIERIGTSDPFQTIGDDLLLKSNTLNYDRVWASIFRDIGDGDSADVMDQIAQQHRAHFDTLLNTLTNIGLTEAKGQPINEKRAA